jgi:hypothetical protein
VTSKCVNIVQALSPNQKGMKDRTVSGKSTCGFWHQSFRGYLEGMAGTTGLEPAASAVTGQRSNQLNYVPTRQLR